jgi:hypothetical protein
VISSGNISFAEEIKITEAKPISIDFCWPGIEISPFWNLGSSLRLWREGHGFEYYFGWGGSYVLHRIRYLHKVKKYVYLGIGYGQANFDSNWLDFGFKINSMDTTPKVSASAVEETTFSEDVIYLSLGWEMPSLIFNWATSFNEIGYIISNVRSFSGDQSYYPKSRFYIFSGLRFRLPV